MAPSIAAPPVSEANTRIQTEFRVETPEGIELEIRPAGPVGRILAYSIDLTIRFGIWIAVSIPVQMAGDLGTGMLLLFAFVLEWFYPVVFEVKAGGRTPGKRMLNLQVVNADATPVGWNASIIRNLLRVADFVPLFYVAGLVSMLCNTRFQRLGDIAAGTIVIHQREEAREGALALAAGSSRPPPVPLRAHEQRVLVDFADRQEHLSEERRVELADILSRLTGSSGADGLRELLRIARGVARGT